MKRLISWIAVISILAAAGICIGSGVNAETKASSVYNQRETVGRLAVADHIE